MKHIRMNAYGNADVLEFVETDTPTIREGEVLINVEAAGVNYSDILRRRNTYFMPTPLPYTPGAEAVGNIVEVGPSETPSPLNVGDRVLALLPYGGGYAEYVAVHHQYCIPLPPHIDAKAATALFVQGSTANLMIQDICPPLENKTVLIHAAAGGVGSLLVQLATMNGDKVIATSSSEEKLNYAASLGADAGVNYSTPGWANRVIEANNGEQVDVILEMVGGDIFTESLNCLKDGGTLITYGAASGEKGSIHSEYFVDRNITVRGFNLAFYMQHKLATWQQSMGSLIQLVAENKLTIRTNDAYPLRDSARAHQRIEDRLTTGKVVLLP